MDALEGKHISLWLDTAPETNFPRLAGKLDTDVLIIGGGLAGIMTSYFLLKEGIVSTMIESHRISDGVTGFSTAKITSLHGLIYDELLNKRGDEIARLYADANQTAIKLYKTVIDHLNIDCDYKEMPAFTYAAEEKDRERVENEVRAAKSLGVPASLDNILHPSIPQFGAVRFDNQARFHPKKFLVSVANYLAKNGVSIYENSPVRKINYKEEPISANTDHGEIRAKKIVVATNYPIIDPDLYFTRLIPRRSYALAAEIEDKLQLGLYYSTEKNFHSFRPHPIRGKEAWIIGSEPHITGREENTIQRYQNLQKWAEEHFKIRKIHYRWSTHDSQTLDKIPLTGRITRDYENIYVATGFKGWGITNTMASARLLADLIAGKENGWEKLYDPSRKSSFTSAKLATFNIPTIATLIGERLKKFPEKLEGIGRDKARVFEIEGNKAAIYKDEKGEIHALSAYCQHMGCVVHWNNAEKTWDCPCHASRYRIDGEVIHSPASRPLERINIQTQK